MAEDALKPGVTPPHPSARSQHGLDWLNFFMADVETAFGPFVALFLTTEGWGQGAIGSVITVNSVIALATQVPGGWLVDRVHAKRLVVAVCIVCIAAGSLLIALFPGFLAVAFGEALHGITGGAVRTSLAAIAIGLVGHRALHTRIGRNHRYDSFGNAATAAGMGALGHLVSPRVPFFAAAGLCLPAVAALLLIRGNEISYARARQAPSDDERRAVRWRDLLHNRALIIFTVSLVLFQFTNASILPLASERLAANYQFESELVVSALVVVPQTITAVIAMWLARKADEWGRRTLLLTAFLALVARTVLFAPDFGPWYLVGIQVLGGVDAAVIGILTPLVIADCTRNTGLYNFTFGAVGMVSGLGAAVSTTATGLVAEAFGFTTAFLLLGGIAAAAVAVLWLLLPETVQESQVDE
jgi:MFS family permease